MAGNYPQIVRSLLVRHNVRVHKWRTSMSGCSWRAWYSDGTAVNWIESPIPRTPISLAIFLHEIGHHVIGFDRYKRRCEEEYYAWMWALSQMRELGIEPDERTVRRVERSMQYAVDKAIRRGIKSLPEALQESTLLAA